MSEEIKLSIIVPAYNESKRIAKTLRTIVSYFKNTNNSYELLVVDDGSKDGTKEVVESLMISNAKVLGYGENRGKGFAINFGVKHARGEWILFTDADNSTPIEEFSKLAAEKADYQVIIGSRYLKESNIVVKQSKLRILLSRIGNILSQVILLPGIKDTQCGFKLFSATAAKQIFAKQTIWRWGFDMEILRIARELSYKVKEVPVIWYNDEQTHLQSRRVFIRTFIELITIKINSLRGLYNDGKNSEQAIFIKFAIVGAIGTALDFGVLNFTHRVLGLSLLPALTLGFSSGAINNYIINSKWTYHQRLTWPQFYQFITIAIGGLAINNVIVYNLATDYSWPYNFAKALAVVIVFFWNYGLNRIWTFAKR